MLLGAPFAMAIACAGGCDPSAVGDQGKTQVAIQTDAQAGKAGKAAKAPPSELAACIDRCRTGDRRTDAETCRLQCEDPEAGTPTTIDTTLARYEICVDGCGSASSTDRATCTLNCAGSTPAAVSEADASERTCMRPCLESLGECSGGCGSGSETDRETCRLQCDANARSCLADCVPSAG